MFRIIFILAIFTILAKIAKWLFFSGGSGASGHEDPRTDPYTVVGLACGHFEVFPGKKYRKKYARCSRCQASKFVDYKMTTNKSDLKDNLHEYNQGRFRDV